MQRESAVLLNTEKTSYTCIMCTMCTYLPTSHHVFQMPLCLVERTLALLRGDAAGAATYIHGGGGVVVNFALHYKFSMGINAHLVQVLKTIIL